MCSLRSVHDPAAGSIPHPRQRFKSFPTTSGSPGRKTRPSYWRRSARPSHQVPRPLLPTRGATKMFRKSANEKNSATRRFSVASRLNLPTRAFPPSGSSSRLPPRLLPPRHLPLGLGGPVVDRVSTPAPVHRGVVCVVVAEELPPASDRREGAVPFLRLLRDGRLDDGAVRLDGLDRDDEQVAEAADVRGLTNGSGVLKEPFAGKAVRS
jgi:hypothetical protein